KESLITHLGIFGSSGYGKTNISLNLAKTLSEQNVPVIIFDFSKRNYRDLLQTDVRDKVEVYTVGRNVAPFRFNPLKPPAGVTKTQWIKEFSSIFDHSYWLMGGGESIIMRALDEIYESKQNPKMQDLKEAIDLYSQNRQTSREANWIATAKRPLESLCFREIGDIFDTDSGDLSRLFAPGKITILELDALSTSDKTFIIEIIMQWMRDWMLASSNREKLVGAIILEEAHHVLNREKSRKLGSETVIDMLFREVRELGLGIIYIDQHPSMVSYPAMGNTSTHIYMNLGLDTKQSSDIQDASNMLGLQEEDGAYLRRLPVGHGFMLMRNSEFSRPFLAEFEKMEIEKGKVADKDVEEHMKEKVRQNVSQIDAVFTEDELTEHGQKIIEGIGAGKGLYTSQLYSALKMSGSTFKENMKTLLRLGLVDQKGVKIKKAKAVYYFLTDMGESILIKNGFTEKKAEKINSDLALKKFIAGGYEVIDQANGLALKKGDTLLKMSFISDYNRDAIYRSITNRGYYLCANAELRNIVIQQACRFAKKKGGVRIFIQLFDEFMRTDVFEGVIL
ncbi:MAG: DUF87 domain-containing protein, partial [Candidatus Aenigmarchaeota archaeon]|nr:DUF87 domain-containing protein [Candidatus Aenigmarchaeota archaeon]